MRFILIIILVITSGSEAFSQGSGISGNVKDESGAPLGFAPVAILNQGDSTLAFFGITDESGFFDIKGIRKGKYILQVSSVGFKTERKDISFPLPAETSPFFIVMKSNPVSLGEVVVSAEYIPVSFKADTLEFNAAAFSTKPDAVVEDLLKKIPGIEVDRSGNIKALGEDVSKVLVDGREFFESDYKLATRNLQADALKKVQVFDKKTEETDFTGIDDGTRYKTLNLILKEEKKNIFFGELLGGGGTGENFRTNAKSYRFTKNYQFAALGMLNNINQFGFSMKDYMDFTGGGLGEGGHSNSVQLKMPGGGGNNFPVNIGQPLVGKSTSGAAGMNFSRQFSKYSRIFMSVIANGTNRDLSQFTSTQNYTDINSFRQEDSLYEKKNDRAQRFNFGIRAMIDSTQFLTINGAAALSDLNLNTISNTLVYNNESEKNKNSRNNTINTGDFAGIVNGSYMKLINRGKNVFNISVDGSIFREQGKTAWENNLLLISPGILIFDKQLQNNQTSVSRISGATSFTQKLIKNFYIKPELGIGQENELLDRTQIARAETEIQIDSLSPYFRQQYLWTKPGLSFVGNNSKSQFTASFRVESGKTINSLNKGEPVTAEFNYFTPGLTWEYAYKTGRKFRMYVTRGITIPSLNQLLPTANVSNPLMVGYGNRYLKPELYNNLFLNWWIFDQFSFTSFMTSVNATYTTNKVNWNRTVNGNLQQTMTLVNVPEDYRIQTLFNLSTPIKKIGIKTNVTIEESWNRGLSYVNEIENLSTNFVHKASLVIENRSKSNWDIAFGLTYQLTDSKFSIQKSLNNIYTDFSYFSEIRYKIAKKWDFRFSADVTNYNSQGFKDAISIPLLDLEISYYFMKNNRGAIILQGTDLLNKDTGIERISEFNYLRERRSNMLGRFIMVSFKYKFQNN